MSRVESLSHDILRELLSEFVTQKRGAMELRHEYAGVPMPALKRAVCGDGVACDVDFDLAVQDLMNVGFVGTGPSMPFENPPDSPLFLIGMRSKHEYAYLTEKGYKAGTEGKTRKGAAPKP